MLVLFKFFFFCLGYFESFEFGLLIILLVMWELNYQVLNTDLNSKLGWFEEFSSQSNTVI